MTIDEEIEKNIKRLKQSIEEAKEEKAEGQGIVKNMMDRLKNELKLPSIAEAENKVVSLTDAIEKIKEEINSEYKKLSENYEW